MTRPTGVKRHLRAFFFSLITLCFSGCLGADTNQAVTSQDSDSLASPPPVRADTSGPGLSTPDSQAQAQPSVEGPEDTAGPPPSQEVAGDTASFAMRDLALRIQRLEEENDSLRIVLQTVIPLLSAGSRAGPLSEPAQGAQEELLPVDGGLVRSWGLRTVLAIFILVVTGIGVRFSAWILEKLAERSAKRRLIFKRMVPILRILLWGLAAFLVIRVAYGVDGREFVAAGAAVGVAVGFAAQDIFKNIFGGLIVLFDQPFQVGDKISVGGTYGEVVSIGLRSTRITTPDDNLVTVPNHQVVTDQVANANSGELSCQVVTDLYLPGWVNEGEAKKIAFDAAVSSKYVFLNKPIVVLVRDKFEDTFLTHLKVKAYVLDPRYEFLFMSDVTERARAGFRRAGLLGPMHGVRAYVDMDRFPEVFRRGDDEEKDGA